MTRVSTLSTSLLNFRYLKFSYTENEALFYPLGHEELFWQNKL